MKAISIILLFLCCSNLIAQGDRFMGFGGVTETSISYRVRTVTAGDLVQLRYTGITSTGFNTVSSDHNTGEETITGLSPSTNYTYDVLVNGSVYTSGQFRTTGGDCIIGFGSCNSTPNGAALVQLASAAPNMNMFFHLGDFGYPNNSNLSNQRANYRTQTNAPSDFGTILRSTSVERVWDDHDFGPNNSNGANTLKQESLRAWNEYTPHYPLDNPTNGTWRDWTMQTDCGEICFYMMDQRYQRRTDGVRHPATGETTATITGNTITLSGGNFSGYIVNINNELRRIVSWSGSTGVLDQIPTTQGTAQVYMSNKQVLDGYDIGTGNQLEWLVGGIQSSSAKWHILVSSSPMTPYIDLTENDAIDTWAGIDTDHLEYDYIKQELKGKNILILSADRHYTGINFEDADSFQEFTCSPLSQSNVNPGDGWDIIFNGEDAYGIIEINDDCTIDMKAVSETGMEVFSIKQYAETNCK